MLKREDVLRFLTAKGVSPQCPECGRNDWYLGGDEKDFSAMVIVPHLENPARLDPLAHVPVVYLVCRHCGHVRSFAKAMIRDYLGHNGQRRTEEETTDVEHPGE